MRGQPVDERCRELGRGTALSARPERVEVERLDVLGSQPGGVVARGAARSGAWDRRRDVGPRAPWSEPTAPDDQLVGVTADAVETDASRRRAADAAGSAWGPSRNTPSKSSPSSSKYPALWKYPSRRPAGSMLLGTMARLGVGDAVRDTRRVGQEPGVRLHDEQPPQLELLDGVVEGGAPDVHLGHLQPEERPEILGRELEEGPLVALEVGADGEGGRGQGIETQGVEQLDPEIDVAIGLGPRPLGGVERMRSVAGRIDRHHPQPGPRAHGQSRSRAAAGQSAGCIPCVRNRAKVMRSRPKPKQHECATSPSAVTIPKGSPKWSRWQLADAIAVGLLERNRSASRSRT